MVILAYLHKFCLKIKKIISNNNEIKTYDFNESNPLGDNGERVDIQLNKEVNFNSMDIYQKNHWRRYEFAKEIINNDDICGDFACGTGYGSILISDKAKKVIGADLNIKVIKEIKARYSGYANVEFFTENLLNLSYSNYFDNIISFETLEHFKEDDLKELLLIFNNALKEKGKLIFSTPYMQEQSEEATKMGFHLTFNINEDTIQNWLQSAGLQVETIMYQNYDTHIIEQDPGKKEFIICVAGKQLINA